MKERIRESVEFFLNGEHQKSGGEDAFRNLSEFLRYCRGLPGTKVVCAEGDCGACTVLVSRFEDGAFGPFQTLNSCIAPVFSLDRSVVITVEGLGRSDALHPVQKAMADAHGAQCGYCTPGFICSLASLADDAREQGFPLEEKRVRNYLTGNLCRCTGYEPILKAGCSIPLESTPRLSELQDLHSVQEHFATLEGAALRVEHGERTAFLPSDIGGALAFLAEFPEARVLAGSTDLGVLANKRGFRPSALLGLHSVPGLRGVRDRGDSLWIGARTTLAEVEEGLKAEFPEFSRSLHLFASPQIKNAGTLVGNLMNASPIADTLPFLRVAGAQLEIGSLGGGRAVDLSEFVKPGYKQLDLRPGELVTGVVLPKSTSRFKIYKASNRRDLDISTVAAAFRYRISEGVLEDFAVALGGVGPSVMRFPRIEAMLQGKKLEKERILEAAGAISEEVQPLSDVRGSAEYRRILCRNLLLRFFEEAGA